MIAAVRPSCVLRAVVAAPSQGWDARCPLCLPACLPASLFFFGVGKCHRECIDRLHRPTSQWLRRRRRRWRRRRRRGILWGCCVVVCTVVLVVATLIKKSAAAGPRRARWLFGSVRFVSFRFFPVSYSGRRSVVLMCACTSACFFCVSVHALPRKAPKDKNVQAGAPEVEGREVGRKQS